LQPENLDSKNYNGTSSVSIKADTGERDEETSKQILSEDYKDIHQKTETDNG
jgi:hypothetical protein